MLPVSSIWWQGSISLRLRTLDLLFRARIGRLLAPCLGTRPCFASQPSSESRQHYVNRVCGGVVLLSFVEQAERRTE